MRSIPDLPKVLSGRGQLFQDDRSPIDVRYQIVMAVVLSAIMPGLFGARTLANGLTTGGLMWLGFVITSMTLNHRYAQAPWSRTFVDGGYLLIALLIQGAIIGFFG